MKKNKKKYNIVTYADIEDYDTMFKTLTFMKEHKCEYCIEINTEGIIETLGDDYEIDNVSLCVSKATGEEGLIPHFVVDVREV